MTLSKDADILWHTALALARRAASVSPQLRPLPALLFFTDPERTPQPWRVAQNLPKGAAVVYRAFSAPDQIETGLKLREACTQAGVLLLVGRDEVLAERISADGIHLPERDLGRSASLRKDHPDWIITSALHTPLEGRSGEGLDAFVVSPVFPAGGRSSSKKDLGLEAFNEMTSLLPCPAYALGGIKPENAPRLLDTQACGIAAIDAIQVAYL